MRNILLFFLLFTAKLQAADTLMVLSKHFTDSMMVFNKHFTDCMNQWVALPPQDTTFIFGFVYLDPSAGLTLDLAGTFSLKNNTFSVEKFETATYKYRLDQTPPQVLVAAISEGMYKKLDIEKFPGWLEDYKIDENSLQYLFIRGYTYNAWDECVKAIPFLERAFKMDAGYVASNGLKLSTELAFSYNCTGDYDNAISVLQTALENDANDAYIYKEIIFAQTHSNRIEDAIKTCQSAKDNCKDTTWNGENVFNILRAFYEKKDRNNFDKWLETAKKSNENNETYLSYIKQMEEEMTDL
ncbi:MAG: tetratricopeptide repeat protein [Tannerella sp.]|jgi:tetratricopeptide (TPR) repeat protein|nr:tetratricopeptide repeat protein [Tannerella sp.]